MGLRASRPALENCLQDLPGVKIDGEQVEETDEVLGSGAYGEVIVALYHGVRYASKKLHEALVENDERIPPNDPNSPVRKFREECQQMSQLRHPNIVQFIGVYFKPNSPPCLLMELLPQSLADFLDENKNKSNITFDRKCLNLLDVAKGLLCLHSHSPPIIHRDLTANNVLLTSGMTAKIADFGVARYLPLPTEVGGQYMTICPGNLNYMPPEAKKENAFYDTKLDIFSFGHLTVYVATRRWPMITDKTFENPVTGDTDYRTETERRKDSLDMMKEENLRLRQLAESCLQDDAERRPVAKTIIKLLSEMIPDTETNFQTLLDEINHLKQKLQAKNLEIDELKRQLAIYKCGPVLKIASSLPLECQQDTDGSISIKLNFNPTLFDPSKKSSSKDGDLKVEAGSPPAIPSTVTTNGSAAQLKQHYNSSNSDTRESTVNSNDGKQASAAAEATNLELSGPSQQVLTRVPPVPRNNGEQAAAEATNPKLSGPSQQILTRIPPVPRTRTKSRTLTVETVTPTANPINVSPLPIHESDQSSVLPKPQKPIPRSNTVSHLGLEPDALQSVKDDATTDSQQESTLQPVKLLQLKERQRSQTLPRIPKPRRNVPEETGGPTNELQALLARRRKWEQTNTK